jgi:hypothetical protein
MAIEFSVRGKDDRSVKLYKYINLTPSSGDVLKSLSDQCNIQYQMGENNIDISMFVGRYVYAIVYYSTKSKWPQVGSFVPPDVAGNQAIETVEEKPFDDQVPF